MTHTEHIKFLESVIDKLISHVVTVGGKPFISRQEFNLTSVHHDAPKDYSYDDYVIDSMDD